MSTIKLDRDSIRYQPEDGKVKLTVDNLSNLAEFPEGPLIELTKGELYVVPSPTIIHQMISQRLNNILYNFVEEKKLGVVLSAPTDVKLSEEDLVIPDIIFVTNRDLIKEKYIDGPPDLIVEVVSSNRKRDLVEKKTIYQRFGVKEYIIVDPARKVVIQCTLNNRGVYGEEIQIQKITLKSLNLEIDVPSIFESL